MFLFLKCSVKMVVVGRLRTEEELNISSLTNTGFVSKMYQENKLLNTIRVEKY